MNSGGVPGQESTPDPVELVKAGGVGAAALVDEDNPLNLDAEVEEVTTKELQTNLEGVSTEVTKLGMQVGGIEGQLKARMAAFEGLSKQLAKPKLFLKQRSKQSWVRDLRQPLRSSSNLNTSGP